MATRDSGIRQTLFDERANGPTRHGGRRREGTTPILDTRPRAELIQWRQIGSFLRVSHVSGKRVTIEAIRFGADRGENTPLGAGLADRALLYK